MLHEASFVAERITAVLTHAVEVCLMLSVTTMRIPAVLVESESVTEEENLMKFLKLLIHKKILITPT